MVAPIVKVFIRPPGLPSSNQPFLNKALAERLLYLAAENAALALVAGMPPIDCYGAKYLWDFMLVAPLHAQNKPKKDVSTWI
jgi:hypothetical protein